VDDAEPDGPVAVGGDLEPGTLLAAYRSGLFPMPMGRRRIGWFSPDPRAVLPARAMHVSRSLQRSVGRFEVTVDARFEEVVRACGDPARPHGWITEDIVRAYVRLHDLGWAHSVEAWQDGRLAGGVYGVSIGSFFAGESMFHRVTDASKVVLVHLCRIMAEVPSPLIDVQWSTPHLASLGVVEVDRAEYLDLLAAATSGPLPPAFRRG
jgi:leucyl/phenylalanyl-tRNA--protein transferase